MLKRFLYLTIVVATVLACNPETDTKKDTQQNDEQTFGKTLSPEKKTTNARLLKVLANGIVQDEFEYKNGKLHKWVGMDLLTFQYDGDKISKIEVWEEDADDQLEKVEERVYEYTLGKLTKILAFDLTEGSREPIYRTEIKYKNGRIAECTTYDLYEGEDVDQVSVFSYPKKNEVQITNGIDLSDPYEKVTMEVLDVPNPYALLGVEYLFDEFDPILPWAVKTQTTTKIRTNKSITENWENTVIENGILKQGVLTLPRTGKPLTYEFIYASE